MRCSICGEEIEGKCIQARKGSLRKPMGDKEMNALDFNPEKDICYYHIKCWNSKTRFWKEEIK